MATLVLVVFDCWLLAFLLIALAVVVRWGDVNDRLDHEEITGTRLPVIQLPENLVEYLGADLAGDG